VLAQGLSISVGGFASVVGDFGFEQFTKSGHTYLGIGAKNVTATVAAGSIAVSATGASLGLLIDTTASPATYALRPNGGHDSLTGIPGLTLSTNGLNVRVRSGLDPTAVTIPAGGIVTPAGTITPDFSDFQNVTGDITDIQGTVTLQIANFVSL